MLGLRSLRALAVLAAALTGGCASIETEVASSTAPEAVGRTFQNLCVSAPQGDLLSRRAIEGAMAAELEAASTAKVQQLGDLMFPGRTYSDEEVREAVRDSGADGFLAVVPLQTWTDTRHVPATISSTWWDHGYRRPMGWGGATTWVSGGYTVSQPHAVFDARLLDVATGEVAWMATVAAQGVPGSTWSSLHTAAARQAAIRLAADGLLIPRNAADQGPSATR